MLNPVLLRTLTVVLRTSSFAEAARELGYTGSAVSQQIAALERSIRMQLFERSAHSIRPTPAAIMLAVFAAFTLGELLLTQMLGFTLAVAVLLDATVVRMVVGPALLQLAGRYNWWPGE